MEFLAIPPVILFLGVIVHIVLSGLSISYIQKQQMDKNQKNVVLASLSIPLIYYGLILLVIILGIFGVAGFAGGAFAGKRYSNWFKGLF